ncbi:hypothetical protein [uncultured Brachyspira sp.]|uniref:hypothetical protein n=1 Tax=uncultured Brachyspira sp. TaxID=221953 RepID=UPI00262549F5|nr:hypothetical protein [uncultured Brachyspira sp.]
MLDYKYILTNILNIANFYSKEKKEKGQYLLLEPIIVHLVGRSGEISKKELESSINSFFQSDNNITIKIIDFYTSKKIINLNRENDTYSLYNSEEVINLFNNYNNLYNENYFKINELSTIFLQNISKSVEETINVTKNLYHFFNDTLNNNVDNTNLIYKNIANILNLLYEHSYQGLDTIKNIIKGMIIIKAIENYKKSSLKEKNKPRIYLDNIFITNLFGWCDAPFYESSILTLEILNEFNFQVCVHNITLELVLDYLVSAKNYQNNLTVNSLFYNIINPDYNNKNHIQTRTKDLVNIKNDIFKALENYNIKIIDNFFLKKESDDPELYKRVHESRQSRNVLKGGIGVISEKQTLYDFTIILLYRNLNITKSNLNNIDTIFITYQKPITENIDYKEYNLYSKIMPVSTFINLLLLESIISNIQEIDKFIDIVLINSYSNVLHSEFINYINNVQKEVNITEEEKNTLLMLKTDKDKKDIIIKNDSNPTLILEELNEREKKLIEKKDKEKQEALDKKDREKKEALDKKDKEKQDALYENEKKYKRDKLIFKVVIIILFSILLFIVSDTYLAPYIIKIANKLKKDIISANYVSLFIGMLPSIITFLIWIFRKK